LDDDEDGAISEGSGDGSDIELVDDGQDPVALSLATQKVPAASRDAQKKPKAPLAPVDDDGSSSGEFDDEFGEFQV
jgi:hypothetical protein